MSFNMMTDSYNIEAEKHLNYTCIDVYNGKMDDSIDLKLAFYDRVTDKYLGAIIIRENDIDTLLDIFEIFLDNYYSEEYFIHTSSSMKVLYSDEFNNIYPSDMDILPVGNENQKFVSFQVYSKGGGVTKVLTSIRNFNFSIFEIEEMNDYIIEEYYSG